MWVDRGGAERVGRQRWASIAAAASGGTIPPRPQLGAHHQPSNDHTRHYALRTSIVVLDVVLDVSLGDALDILSGAQDGAAQGRLLEGSCVQMVKHQLSRVTVDLIGVD